ncbi:MAG: glycosyltransferase [Minicystis sp.]
MADALGALALGWALIAGNVELEAVRRFVFARRAEARTEAARDARVLLIRPCAGRDPWLDETLISLARARRSFSLTCRLAIADPDDSAYPVAVHAAMALSVQGIDTTVVLTAPRGPNRKAAQLAAVVAAEAASFDVIMIADGDVDLADMDLDTLIAPLVLRPDLGAVWAPPVEAGRERTLGDRASAALLGASLHAFPLLARLDRRGLVGKLFAVRRDALAEVGGFAALTAHLGEDMELARRLHACGRGIEAAPIIARSLSSGRSWEQAEDRFGRWLKVIRAQRPSLLASYPLLFFATLPIIVLAAFAAPASPALSAIAAAIALTLRLAVARTAAVAAGRRLPITRIAMDALLADLLLACAFVRALRSRRVVWRDVALRIGRGGQLCLLEEKGDGSPAR